MELEDGQYDEETAVEIVSMVVDLVMEGRLRMFRDATGSVVVGFDEGEEPLQIGSHEAVSFRPLAVLIDRVNGDRIIDRTGIEIPDAAYTEAVEDFLESLDDES